jgi:arylsulfatase A-like enzyme
MKKNQVSRRDALKIIGALGASLVAAKALNVASSLKAESADAGKPNFIVIVFDTLSARHLSLHGYGRKTTPNIEKFAKTSTVFHRTYAPSNFTTSSAASMLTGVYPWSHRALDFYSPLLESFNRKNIFSQTSSVYQSTVYTHNVHVLNILEQFQKDVTLIKPIADLVTYNANQLPNSFKNDHLMGFYATKRWRETFYAPSYSLFLQPAYAFSQTLSYAQVNEKYKEQYPLGLGDRDGYLFRLEDAIDWIIQYAARVAQPFLGYFHLLPPHEDYRPRAEFLGMFANDGFKTPDKPEHFFTNHIKQEQLLGLRQLYDEYIAMVDAEFGRLIQELQNQGTLDNAYLILTSDHGQLLERGVHGHSDPPMYEGALHVPLIVHAPGQTAGKDVHSLTSLLDIVPTILHLAQQPELEYVEGRILPGLGGEEDADRIVFSMHARQNAKLSPLTKVSLAAMQGKYKFVQYKGYTGYANVEELFDLENDPEELNNIAAEKSAVAAMLKDALQKNQSAAEKKSIGA